MNLRVLYKTYDRLSTPHHNLRVLLGHDNNGYALFASLVSLCRFMGLHIHIALVDLYWGCVYGSMMYMMK